MPALSRPDVDTPQTNVRDVASTTPLANAAHETSPETLEFYDGVSSMVILGEVFGRKYPNRVVRMRDADDANVGGSIVGTVSSNKHYDYLQQSGAYTLPPHRTLYGPLHVPRAC